MMKPWDRAILGVLAVGAYALRFGSTWWLLDRVGTARFDPHAYGLLGDAILLLVLAAPLAGLLGWTLWRGGRWRGLLAPASRPGWTAVSVVLLVVLGAPTPNQVWAVILLPLSQAWPVLLSAGLWFAIVAVLRAVSVGGPVLERR